MSTVRYKKSIEPVSTDGRDIDPRMGALSGEAADQKASGAIDEHIARNTEVSEDGAIARAHGPSYYDQPLLQEPVWEWVIPAYYYVGGLAGASLVLGAAAQLGSSKNAALVSRSHWIGVAGCTLSSGFLIYDLGRPERFLNMLRVFRPTSPMNVGAWILSGAGGAATGAALFKRFDGFPGAVGSACSYIAGILGAGLATYTGVLLSNSAVPVWQESRRVLPALFGASAMASSGAILDLISGGEGFEVSRAFGTTGRVAELTLGIVLEREVSVVPRVGRPLKQGVTGVMWKSAIALTATSIVVGFLPNQSRAKRVTAALLATGGSLLMRFAIHYAGKASTRDARASFQQQRAGRGAAALS